jgi:cytochrome c
MVGVSASALVMLAACGGGEEEKAPAASASATAPATPATAPAETAATTPDAAGAAAPATTTAAAPAAAAGAPAAAGAAGGVTLAGLTGDATRGQKVFGQCRTCHTVEAGVNKVGPSLAGIVGRPAGTIPGFRYSPANKNSGITWSEDVMFAYLENPRKYIPGTYMSYVGLKDPQQRADVIAYLKAPT